MCAAAPYHQLDPNGFLQHLLYEIYTFGMAANEPEQTFATPPIRNGHFRVGFKRTRTDFCNTSYTKWTLSGLGDQLSGLLEPEPERIFVAPPVRNAHFRVPPPLGLYII